MEVEVEVEVELGLEVEVEVEGTARDEFWKSGHFALEV